MPHERHFTVPELHKLWNLSTDTIRKKFLCEPGVIIITEKKRGIRVYRTLRIPESVAIRVYRRWGGKL